MDKRIYKKCIKCREWKPRKPILNDTGDEVIEKHGFGDHESSSDGLQSICFACKNKMNNKARDRNVTARVRHHTGTRCLTQLGPTLTPKNFVANLEDYLGYRISTLVKHLSSDLKAREGSGRKLRDALNEGYHIDHIRPLSLFVVARVSGMGSKDGDGSEDGDGGSGGGGGDDDDEGWYVDWDEFRRCWAIDNLCAIPAAENLAKGATYASASASAELSATLAP